MKHLTTLCAFMGGAALGATLCTIAAHGKGREMHKRIAAALRERGISMKELNMDALADKICQHIHNHEEEE